MEEMDGLSALEDIGYDMEGYAPISDLAEDYEFFGIGQMMNPEMLKSHLIAGAAGAGGILTVSNVFDRIDYFADKPKGRALAEAVVGLVGGRMLWKVNRDAAMGFVGGVTGYALAGLINQYIAEMSAESQSSGNGTEALNYTEVRQVPSYIKRDRVSVPAGWSGLGRDIVTRANYLQVDGLEGESDAIGSWVS